MSKQLQLLDELDDKQREFFAMLMDPTSPHFSDVPRTSEMVFGNPGAGEVIMSSPAGRAWRELHLQRDRDGIATMLVRIAYGETARRTREIVYKIDENGKREPVSERLVSTEPSQTERLKAVKMLREFGFVTDNIADRVKVRRLSRERMLA